MAFEETLSTYGVLGIWTAYQIYKETTLHKKLIDTLENLNLSVSQCPKKKHD